MNILVVYDSIHSLRFSTPQEKSSALTPARAISVEEKATTTAATIIYTL